MSINVDINIEDFMISSHKASLRQFDNIVKGRIGHDHGASSKRKLAQRLGDSIIGQMGQTIVAHYLSLPETAFFNDTKASDIAGNIEVRTTEYTNGHLLLHKTSKDDACYILVVIQELKAKICGWLTAEEGKREEFWREGDPGCYYVPQSFLKPIDSLKISRYLVDTSAVAKI